MAGAATSKRWIDWQRAKRVLAIRLDSMGDVLMTTPAICALVDSLPGRQVTLLTSPAGEEVSLLIPEIHDTIVYEAPWMKATAPTSTSQADLAMIERLQAEKFDAAVIFTVYSQSPLPAALLCFLAEIPLRLAYCRENPYQLLTDWVKEVEPEQTILHEVQRHLNLVESIGCTTSSVQMSFQPTQSDRLRVVEVLKGAGIQMDKPYVVIHPGASAPSRRYPAELFAQVTKGLAERGLQIIFTGSHEEQKLVQSIQGRLQGIPSISLEGRLSLGQLGALLESSQLLISNNTGPVHLAAAIGTPVLDLYALTNPQHTPWAVRSIVLSHDVPCKFCYRSICPEGHHNCLRLIDPLVVINAAETLLRGGDEAEFFITSRGLGLYQNFLGREDLKTHEMG